MQVMPVHYGPDILKISHSSLGTLQSCDRRFNFAKLFPQRRYTADYAAMVGQAGHAGYQDYLINRDRDKALYKMLRAWDVRIDSKNQYEQRTMEALISTLNLLFDRFDALNGVELAYVNVNGEERPAVEVPFQINLLLHGKPYEVRKGLPVVYIGFIDDILFDTNLSEYFVDDLKTHRLNLEDYTPMIKFSDQPLPYALVLNAALGLNLKSLNVVYTAAYIDLLEPRVERIPLIKDQEDIHDWAKKLLRQLERIKQNFAMDFWPRNSNSCVSFNKACKFFDYCDTKDKMYLHEIFSNDSKAVYYEQDFEPWFTLDLELGT